MMAGWLVGRGYRRQRAAWLTAFIWGPEVETYAYLHHDSGDIFIYGYDGGGWGFLRSCLSFIRDDGLLSPAFCSWRRWSFIGLAPGPVMKANFKHFWKFDPFHLVIFGCCDGFALNVCMLVPTNAILSQTTI